VRRAFRTGELRFAALAALIVCATILVADTLIVTEVFGGITGLLARLFK
jgi:hypothetical protein